MPSISAVFLILSLVLAVVIGPQTRSWSWGPAMIALAISVSAALPALWRKKDHLGSAPLLALGFTTACWFAWRALISPVAEFGNADLMLLAGATGAFVSLQVIRGDAVAGKIVIWGIALLLVANVLVIAKQVSSPGFAPVFQSTISRFPTGFYAHYNEAANYLIASSLLVAAAALFGKLSVPSRLLLAVISVSGLVAVYFTHSRGGILGAAVGTMVLACTALVFSKRDGSRWFAPGLVALPLIAIAAGGFLLTGWQTSQELRQAGTGVSDVMDNDVRLFFLGLAVSTVSVHPLAGGGSRSFSWESILQWDPGVQGDARALPQFVHNEFIQSATDYGIIGALLLAFVLGGFVLAAILRMLFGKLPDSPDHTRAWLTGGCAALAGMLVQSSFSFVFHLFPGVLLLGISLSLLLPGDRATSSRPRRAISPALLFAAAMLCLLVLIPAGVKGSRVTRILWSSYISNTATDVGSIGQLGEAVEIDPRADLLIDRASRLQNVFIASGGRSTDLAGQAVRDYESARELNPRDPQPCVNQANLLSLLERDTEAEALFERGIPLQGGFEAVFRNHFSYANHLFRKGRRLFNRENPEPALAALEAARSELGKASEETPAWMLGPADQQFIVMLYENLGAVREAAGDLDGALEAYDFATTRPAGARANFRVGQLTGKKGKATWDARKPAEALWYFTEAKRRIRSSPELPPGVTPSQRLEYLTYLDKCIAYLNGAHVQPVKPAE